MTRTNSLRVSPRVSSIGRRLTGTTWRRRRTPAQARGKYEHQPEDPRYPRAQAAADRVRRRRRRRQRRQQHDHGRASGGRLRGRQHRRPGADHVEGRAHHPDGRAGDRRSRRRLAARRRARRRRGGDRRNPRSSDRRAHGVRHRRHGRRHRHRRGAGDRPGRQGARHPHRRRRHQAVPLRRPAPHEVRGSRHRRTAEMRRHPDHHPEPEPVPGGEREDHLRRRLRDGRPGALFGRRLHHRPDGEGRPDQPRLRRRPRRSCARWARR